MPVFIQEFKSHFDFLLSIEEKLSEKITTNDDEYYFLMTEHGLYEEYIFTWVTNKLKSTRVAKSDLKDDGCVDTYEFFLIENRIVVTHYRQYSKPWNDNDIRLIDSLRVLHICMRDDLKSFLHDSGEFPERVQEELLWIISVQL